MTMKSPWQELRDSNQDLGLLFLFIPGKKRDLCADIFLLGFELDNAIHIPSEIMLAAIRLQWWRDALSDTAPSKVPLVQRLQRHIDDGLIERQMVLAMVDGWQDRIGDSDLNPQLCWGGCWALVARILSDSDAKAAEAALIGRDCMTLMIQPSSRLQPGTPVSHDGLPALFRVTTALADYWRAHPTASSDDPLMIWRMLGWRYGIGRS